MIFDKKRKESVKEISPTTRTIIIHAAFEPRSILLCDGQTILNHSMTLLDWLCWFDSLTARDKYTVPRCDSQPSGKYEMSAWLPWRKWLGGTQDNKLKIGENAIVGIALVGPKRTGPTMKPGNLVQADMSCELRRRASQSDRRRPKPKLAHDIMYSWIIGARNWNTMPPWQLTRRILFITFTGEPIPPSKEFNHQN